VSELFIAVSNEPVCVNDHEMTIAPLSGVATTTGVYGAPKITTEVDVALVLPVAFVAVAVNVYVSKGVRPVKRLVSALYVPVSEDALAGVATTAMLEIDAASSALSKTQFTTHDATPGVAVIEEKTGAGFSCSVTGELVNEETPLDAVTVIGYERHGTSPVTVIGEDVLVPRPDETVYVTIWEKGKLMAG